MDDELLAAIYTSDPELVPDAPASLVPPTTGIEHAAETRAWIGLLRQMERRLAEQDSKIARLEVSLARLRDVTYRSAGSLRGLRHEVDGKLDRHDLP